MKKKTYTFNGRRVSVKAESYRNNGTLAIMIKYDDGDSEVITTNLCSLFQSKTMAFLDTNNYPDIEKWIQKNKIGLPMGVSERSGFCEYPLYTFFDEAL